MTETTTTYYALTGSGWGRGATPAEAVANYRKAIKRDYPKVTQEMLDESWGFVWKAPEGTTGHSQDSSLWWIIDGESVKAEASQRVHTIGNVPVSVFNTNEGR